MAARQSLTQEIVKSKLDYDLETGIFRWKIKPTHNVNIGDIAGTTGKGKNLTVWLCGSSRLLKRVAVLYVEGFWPNGDVICIDGDVTNLKYKNLKVVKNKQSEEAANDIKIALNDYWAKKANKNELYKTLDNLLNCKFIDWVSYLSNVTIKDINFIVMISLYWNRETEKNKILKLKALEKMLRSTKTNWLLKFKAMELSMVDYLVIQEIKRSNSKLEYCNAV